MPDHIAETVIEPIFVGTDGSHHADAAVTWAADEAALLRRPLRIVHVVERWLYDVPRYPLKGMRDPLLLTGRELLADAEKLARDRQPHVDVSTDLIEDEAAHALQRLAEGAFEIVVGNRGHGGFADLLLGSTGLRLADRATGPVVIVRGEPDTRHGTLVAGIDLDADSTDMLAYAFAAAAARGARLHGVYASQRLFMLAGSGYTAGMEELAQEVRSRLAHELAPWRERHAGLDVSSDVILGHPVGALVDASRTADLVVLGAKVRSRPEIRLGSVSHGVIHHAHCPVTVVRHRN